MKDVGFKPGVELPDLKQLALIRMHHEYELERLGTAAPMHDTWAPFFPANAYTEDRSDAVLPLFQQWLDRRVNTVGRVWLPLRCGSTVAPMTLADCKVGGGNRFARTDGAHAAAQDFARRFEGRQLRIADVGAYGNGLLFGKPLNNYTVSDTAQPEGSGSTTRHEVELVIERVDVDGKFVVWHVLPGQIRSRPWSAVWPLG